MAEVIEPVTALRETPLDVAAHLAAVGDAAVGAIASFVGTVRDHSPDAPAEVTGLVYSAHPDAAAALARIAGEVAAAHPGVRMAVSHRVGALAVGDIAIVAVAAAPHRAESFDACRDLVEAVKANLPVWKKQDMIDGNHVWVGSA